jgi:ABC-2 type transport system permease protein
MRVEMSAAKLTRLVASRELSEQLRSKTFRLVSLALVLAVAAGVLVPAAIGDSETSQTVGVVGGPSPGLRNASILAGKVSGVDNVFVRNLESEADARRALVDGSVDAVIVNGQTILLKKERTAGVESTTTSLADALAQLIGVSRALAAMPATDRGQIDDQLKLPIRGVQPAGTDVASRIAGMAGIFIIYIFILVNGMKITQGVAEEKSTRVIEVLLSGVRPLQLLIGKVAGVGAAAGLQALAMLATFLICGAIVGDNLVIGDAGQVVLAGAIWLVLGYCLYCTLFAAAGALITRQADASSVSFPLMLPLILSFALGISVLFSEPSTFFKLLAYIPFTAPVAMTALYAIGDASVYQFMLSMAITLITTAVAFRVSAIVFERAILRTGARVKVGEVLRTDDA